MLPTACVNWMSQPDFKKMLFYSCGLKIFAVIMFLMRLFHYLCLLTLIIFVKMVWWKILADFFQCRIIIYQMILKKLRYHKKRIINIFFQIWHFNNSPPKRKEIRLTIKFISDSIRYELRNIVLGPIFNLLNWFYYLVLVFIVNLS
jgi:hypothetical protein